MKRAPRNSYQGFRKHSSSLRADSHQQQFKQDLNQIEHLSQELSMLSQKGNTSFCSNPSSSTTQVRQYRNSANRLRHSTSLTGIDLRELENDEDERQFQPHSVKGLQDIQAIEESHSFCEEEPEEEIKENPLKYSTKTVAVVNKNPPARNVASKNVRNTPLGGSSRNVVPKTSSQGQKGKFDVSELDFMKKQLDNRNKDPKGKTQVRNTGFRKAKEPVKEAVKVPTNRRIPGEKVEQKSLLMPPKMSGRMNEPKEEVMVPKRMLTQKEKGGLVMRLMQLKEQIEKSEICCDSLPEISRHLQVVEDLLNH